jgi:hypothetical protein
MVGIISDIHDNLPNLAKALNYFKVSKIKRLICCGDIGSEETLVYLVENFSGQIWSVLGNADAEQIEYQKFKDKFDNLNLFESTGQFAIEGKQILIVHEPWRYEKYLDNPEIEYIFYGHSHKPWQETQNNKIILNPGNVANQIYSPSLATWSPTNNDFKLTQINLLK